MKAKVFCVVELNVELEDEDAPEADRVHDAVLAALPNGISLEDIEEWKILP
jgi:hypothetical protein